MGALVNRKQRDAVLQGLDYLKAQTEVLHDGQSHTLVDADAASCCVGPTLLGTRDAAGSDASGRVHTITPDVAALHTGHGNVMPQSLHGGPGRAGGGEELGGVRALNFYHRRSALQASSAVLAQLNSAAAT